MSALPRLDQYPSPCRCSPGTEATGWHEVRCAACSAVDRAVWARAMRTDLRSVVERVKADPRTQCGGCRFPHPTCPGPGCTRV